ncbi:ADP-ribosyl-[dinitrogen reductase] hydrolase [Alteromonadaceae bacterium 2753L.S.0a.02]|nr:ADP-ribosyl-[dinitrogen reductase] hydrolase [Alteromonadaceae bacterium 2753L.S.0a.02]
MLDRKQRYRGCLLGLAVGDALGTSLEFSERGSFSPINDMLGGGPFHLRAGQWTDDTSMALCLATSLIESRGFDANDQMNRYCNWRTHGYMSSTGRCFDIGVTVSEALSAFQRTGEPFSGSDNPFSAGNGSLMRLAPVAMFYSPDVEKVIHYCGESSRTTHAAKECIDACKLFGEMLHLALLGADKNTLAGNTSYQPETRKLQAIKSGDYLHKTESDIHGTGYAVQSLEAALWCFHGTSTYQEAVLAAANLGDDADTTAAICGQIAGSYYGVDAIPDAWLQKLTQRADIQALADQLAG